MTVSVQWLFLAVSWVGLQCVVMAFPDHTHILFLLERPCCGISLGYVVRTLHIADFDEVTALDTKKY